MADPAFEEEWDEDPATELAHHRATPADGRYADRQLGPLPTVREESAEDARTVRVSRMPVSFIGESVTDPDTRVDTSAAASRWRASGPVDEIDLLMDPYSLEPDAPLHTPMPAARAARGVERPLDQPPISTLVISLLLGAVIGVGAVAIAALLLT